MLLESKIWTLDIIKTEIAPGKDYQSRLIQANSLGKKDQN
jgi:hypothetical protein